MTKKKNFTLRKPFSGGASFFGPGLMGKRSSRRGTIQRRVRKIAKRARSGSTASGAKWNRLSHASKKKVAEAAGVSPRVSDAWARLRWSDIPDPAKGSIFSALGAARNPMQKKKKRKKTQKRKPVTRRRRRPTVRRAAKKKNSRRKNRARRPAARPRVLNLDVYLSPKNRQRLGRFVSGVTGRRVKVK